MQGNSGDKDIENRLTDMAPGVEGECGRYGENNWKHTLTHVKWIANENLLYDLGNSN